MAKFKLTRVCLKSVYFVKIKKILLKILYIKVKVS